MLLPFKCPGVSVTKGPAQCLTQQYRADHPPEQNGRQSNQSMTETENHLLENLLGRVAMKDQQALRKLYDLTSARLNGVAYRILQNRELSHEALQEGILQVWNNAADYRASQGEPMAWLTSLVRYRALDKLRAEQSEQRRRDQLDAMQDFIEEPTGMSVAEALEQGAMNERLNLCLQTLDTLNRNAIMMAYYYGYSRDDIAEHLAQPLNTIKSWLKRGLERLSKCLS